jgi:hypothetical protein
MAKPIPQRAMSKELDLDRKLSVPQQTTNGKKDIIQVLEAQADEM